MAAVGTWLPCAVLSRMSRGLPGTRVTCEDVFHASTQLAGEGRNICIDGIGTLFHYLLRYLEEQSRWLPSASVLFSLRLPANEAPVLLLLSGTAPRDGLWREMSAEHHGGDMVGTVQVPRLHQEATFIGIRSAEVILPVVASHLPPTLEQGKLQMYSQTLQAFGDDPFHALRRPRLHTEDTPAAQRQRDDLAARLTSLVLSLSSYRSLNLSMTLLRTLARIAHFPGTSLPSASDFFLLRLATTLQHQAGQQSNPHHFFEIDDWNYSANALFGARKYRELVNKLQGVLNDAQATAAAQWEGRLHFGVNTEGLVHVYKDAFVFYRTWLRKSLDALDGPGRIGLLTPEGKFRDSSRRPSAVSLLEQASSPRSNSIAPFPEPASETQRRPSVIPKPPQEEIDTHAGELSDWIEAGVQPRRPSLAPPISPSRHHSRSPHLAPLPSPGPQFEPGARRGSASSVAKSIMGISKRMFRRNTEQ